MTNEPARICIYLALFHWDSHISEPIPKRSNLLETLPSWGKSFHIEADITVKKLPTNGYANIFRFTKGGKKFREYGTRIPALWIHGWKAQNRGFFHLQSGTNNDTFYVFNSFDFELGRKYRYSIHQALKQDGEYHLVASVDGSEIFDHVIKNPEDFSDVKLYLSDPWQESFGDYGELENFTWNAL